MMMMNIPAVWLYFFVGALAMLFIAVLFYVLKRREYLWLLSTSNERLAQQTALQEEKTLQINELQNKTKRILKFKTFAKVIPLQNIVYMAQLKHWTYARKRSFGETKTQLTICYLFVFIFTETSFSLLL